jgi:hypothetical protein
VVQYIGKYSLYRAAAASRVPGDMAVG